MTTRTVLNPAAAIIALAAPGSIAAPGAIAAGGQDFCRTQEHWAAKAVAMRGGLPQPVGGGCPTKGSCDVPATRDSYIPNGLSEYLTLRVHVIVFAEDDGTNPAVPPGQVFVVMSEANDDFAPHKIQFVYTQEVVNDSTYRFLADSDETTAMKATYAVDPHLQCNVFITDHGSSSFGTFPWDPDTLTADGGVVLDDGHAETGDHVITHELGHNVGLWHTHHGVDEVDPCDPCYEQADGTNPDTTGDFASDTPPTPRNWECFDPGGNDECSATPWGVTQVENYMGYAGHECWSLFTPQQAGRARCWIFAELTGWLAPDAPCAADLNGDGGVDTLDFLQLLGEWGPCPLPGPCEADINGDGAVDTIDLLQLLGSWGPC